MVDSTNVQINLFVVDPKVLERWIICEISPSTSGANPAGFFTIYFDGGQEVLKSFVKILYNEGHNSGEVQLEFLRY